MFPLCSLTWGTQSRNLAVGTQTLGSRRAAFVQHMEKQFYALLKGISVCFTCNEENRCLKNELVFHIRKRTNFFAHGSVGERLAWLVWLMKGKTLQKCIILEQKT